MDAKKNNKSAPTDEELLAQFEELENKDAATKSTKGGAATSISTPSEKDLLAELGSLATQRPGSRPSTPSLKSSTTPGIAARSPSRASSTDPAGIIRSSEDQSAPITQSQKSVESIPLVRRDADNARPETLPKLEPKAVETFDKGSKWWGGLLSTATAAVGHAQAAVKEMQQGEEAQKWGGQVRDNVAALKGIGGDLRSMALPTFEHILQTIAPPISSHERLQIHITHDLSGYPTLDPLIYSVFSRVMSQVEGGDLMVVQKGKEASPRRASEHRGSGNAVNGWNDGPWWRSSDERSINAVRGVVEGSKLARAGAESYASEYFSSRGGIEEAAKQATEALSESNPTRTSDIFLAVQAIVQPPSKDLFVAGLSSEQETGVVKELETSGDEEAMFAAYLHDPIHGIDFHALSQAVPNQWLDWLDASSSGHDGLSDSIAEILSTGSVDPREWVAEWVEETLTLVIGVVAQKYVARRMGLGEGGVGKGKMKADKGAEDTVGRGGGEAARAVGGI